MKVGMWNMRKMLGDDSRGRAGGALDPGVLVSNDWAGRDNEKQFNGLVYSLLHK
jgi:hypothetical protein